MKFLLTALSIVTTLVASDTDIMTGYIIDKTCVENCEGLDEEANCTPDGINVFYRPEEHTGQCLLIDICVESKYFLMSDHPADETGTHSILLDLAGSQNEVLSYIKKGTKGKFPKVLVEYNNSTEELNEDGILDVTNAKIRDPWENSHYDGADTNQVVCPNAAFADVKENNFCFRFDVEVQTVGDKIVIESNGCPDHKNMQDGSGVIPNPQDESSFECGGCSSGDKATCGCGCSSGDKAACGCGCCNDNSCSKKFVANFQHYTMVIPAVPGEPGISKKIRDDVVGILSNGVLLDSHKQTWAYDTCGGHSDTKGQYHYHIPPSCFLKDMGMTFDTSSSWWINDEGSEVRQYIDMANQFSTTGSPSPVIGRALDGFPIYALYDEEGNLQRSADFGGTVDECNGKVDSKGNYGYYITVDPPFAPSCLKGENIGYFTYHKTDKECPADGIKNEYQIEEDSRSAGNSKSFSVILAAVAAILPLYLL